MRPISMGPAWMPIPTRSGLPISRPSLALTWSRARSMARAARSTWRQPASTPWRWPNMASRPSPRNLSIQPPWVWMAVPAGGEELVQDENHVVGKTALRQLGEVAQVERTSRPGSSPAPSQVQLLQLGAFRPGAGRPQQARDGHRACRPDLAGQAHVGRRGDAGQRDGFRVAGRRKRAGTLVDAHATSRAACAPAANGRRVGSCSCG